MTDVAVGMLIMRGSCSVSLVMARVLTRKARIATEYRAASENHMMS